MDRQPLVDCAGWWVLREFAECVEGLTADNGVADFGADFWGIVGWSSDCHAGKMVQASPGCQERVPLAWNTGLRLVEVVDGNIDPESGVKPRCLTCSRGIS